MCKHTEVLQRTDSEAGEVSFTAGRYQDYMAVGAKGFLP